MRHCISNEKISVIIDSCGAEICSVKDNKGKEYIWEADGTYWGRHAPVLFPVVGKFRDCRYRYKDQEYSMGQHGFARDMEFVCRKQKEEEIWFELQDDEETRSQYPFAFTLMIGYRLRGQALSVIWRVKNGSQQEKMYFSIGAHPAFVCPWAEHLETPYRLGFAGKENLSYRFLNEEGLLEEKVHTLLLEDGKKTITPDFFDESAYVIEDGQLSEVALETPEGEAYVTVRFDAPVVGIWSPEKKHAPFVCIEPWYGRCDKADFTGRLEAREWGNVLLPQKEFERSYEIIFG